MKTMMKDNQTQKAILYHNQERLVLRQETPEIVSFEEFGFHTRMKKISDAIFLKTLFKWGYEFSPLLTAIITILVAIPAIPFLMLTIVALGWGVIQAFVASPWFGGLMFIPMILAMVGATVYVNKEDKNHHFNSMQANLDELVLLPQSVLWDMSDDLIALDSLNDKMGEGVAALNDLDPADPLHQSVKDKLDILNMERDSLINRLRGYAAMADEYTDTDVLPVIPEPVYDEKKEERAFSFLSQ